MHLSPSLLSSIAAIVLLILGAYSGTVDVLRVPLRAMHLGIAALFGLSVPLAVYAHCKRFFVYGAGDAVAWLHFVMLAALLLFDASNDVAWAIGGFVVGGNLLFTMFMSRRARGRSHLPFR